jgi:alcohol dehydrogenase YqhD (iron-dependent ADH family)
VLRNSRRAKKAAQGCERSAHCGPGLDVLPPKATVAFPVVFVAFGFDMLLHVLERGLVARSVRSRKTHAKVNDPCAAWSLGEIHSINPWDNNIGIGLSVGVG